MCTWSYPSNSVKCTQYNTEYCGLSTLNIPDNDPTQHRQRQRQVCSNTSLIEVHTKNNIYMAKGTELKLSDIFRVNA